MDPTQDRDSPEAVIRRYSDMVYRLAFARTGNRSDAEDLYQEVFLRYLTRAPAFTSEEHRKAWLLRVAVNCANRFHTAPWRRRTEPLSEALSVPAPEGEDLWEELRRLPEKDLLVQVLRVAAVPRPGESQAVDHVRVPPDDRLRAVPVLSWVHVLSSFHPKHPAGSKNVAGCVKKYFTTSEDLV